MPFVKATKEKAKLRLAIFGPSGSGKTYTALRIAKGFGGLVGFIDTERRTARKYSDRFDFDVAELDDRTVDGYCRQIREAGDAFNTLIIDSLSHAWQELLDEVEKLAKAKYRGNTWSAWSEGMPKQKRLVDAILNCPAHVIVTMRSKTAWSEERDERTGKIRPVKVGLSPEQSRGIEYEFDMLMELNTEHIATISKDRTGKFQDQIIEKPGEEFAQQLLAWLSDGATVVKSEPSKPTAPPLPPGYENAQQPAPATKEQVAEMVSLCDRVPDETVEKWFAKAGIERWDDMDSDMIQKCIEYAKKRQPAAAAA